MELESRERLFDVEKYRRADLLQFKGGGYGVNESMTLLDCGMGGEKAELVIGDCVDLKWEKPFRD